MTRVLLSGASGFIGSNVLEHFVAHTDWEFVCVCSWRHHGNPLNIKPGPRIEVVTHDLVGPIPDMGRFDYILNIASESHVDRSIAEPVKFIETNVSSTLQMLEYARRHSPKMFIQFSTDEVFGATDHEEWGILLPSNPYSGSKAAQEMIAIAYWSTYKVPVVITNSNNIVGPRQDPEKFIPKIIDLIRQGKPVEIHVTNGNPGRRYYNSVRNVASALKFIIEHPRPRSNRPTRFSLPGGEEIDNLSMAQRIAKLLDKPLDFVLVDAENVRPGYDSFYPQPHSGLSDLGWEPEVIDLTDELRRVVADHKVQ